MKKFIALFVAAVAILAVSCKKNDTPSKPSVDLTEINALISQCETLVNGATTAKYPQASIDAFKKVIADVKTAAASAQTQAAVTSLITRLNDAKKTCPQL